MSLHYHAISVADAKVNKKQLGSLESVCLFYKCARVVEEWARGAAAAAGGTTLPDVKVQELQFDLHFGSNVNSIAYNIILQ